MLAQILAGVLLFMVISSDEGLTNFSLAITALRYIPLAIC